MMRTGGKSSEHGMKGDEMRCTFRADPQQFWIGNLSKLKKIKFGNDNDVASRTSEEFIFEKSICTQCFKIACDERGKPKHHVAGVHEGHFCECGKHRSSSGLSAVQRQMSQEAFRARAAKRTREDQAKDDTFFDGM
jgi:hypothetical protein